MTNTNSVELQIAKERGEGTFYFYIIFKKLKTNEHQH
uniref:Uncharacterized protein n=1 Tax=Rhizophora mucronata TaxID=61149 RepID=A0A2P2PZI6_RHIMU